ncbi:hypothetical protein K438DRAFT_86162 [Mycena galopus ATCC 62051]|nr:hypothetical protein K438DRAFT_86162 [Mycena galopus ATCC 62051]
MAQVADRANAHRQTSHLTLVPQRILSAPLPQLQHLTSDSDAPGPSSIRICPQHLASRPSNFASSRVFALYCSSALFAAVWHPLLFAAVRYRPPNVAFISAYNSSSRLARIRTLSFLFPLQMWPGCSFSVFLVS